eukprot:6035510-Pyramimonas_sp.AAC.1
MGSSAFSIPFNSARARGHLDASARLQVHLAGVVVLRSDGALNAFELTGVLASAPTKGPRQSGFRLRNRLERSAARQRSRGCGSERNICDALYTSGE